MGRGNWKRGKGGEKGREKGKCWSVFIIGFLPYMYKACYTQCLGLLWCVLSFRSNILTQIHNYLYINNSRNIICMVPTSVLMVINDKGFSFVPVFSKFDKNWEPHYWSACSYRPAHDRWDDGSFRASPIHQHARGKTKTRNKNKNTMLPSIFNLFQLAGLQGPLVR